LRRLLENLKLERDIASSLAQQEKKDTSKYPPSFKRHRITRRNMPNYSSNLQGGAVQIEAIYPAGIIGTTVQNLKAAAEGEKHEWGTLYPNFATIAEEEGFMDIAHTFRMVAQVEAYHERRYLKLLENVAQGTVFKKNKPIKWKCRNCGHVHESSEAPEKCPVCSHPRSYFEVWTEDY
jgi:rubrerythrin